jgi:hypothetical protein
VGGKVVVALLGMPVLGCVAAVLLLTAIATDSDKYGRVAVPGEEKLDLQAGTVHVYYAESTTLGADSTLHEPDLEITIASADGGPPLELEDTSSVVNVEGLGNGAATSIARVEVEDAGRYSVTAGGDDALAREAPEVTLGTNPAGELSDRALGLLLSPWAAGYVALVLLATFTIRWRRSRSP